jgi:hypothetical protein
MCTLLYVVGHRFIQNKHLLLEEWKQNESHVRPSDQCVVGHFLPEIAQVKTIQPIPKHKNIFFVGKGDLYLTDDGSFSIEYTHPPLGSTLSSVLVSTDTRLLSFLDQKADFLADYLLAPDVGETGSVEREPTAFASSSAYSIVPHAEVQPQVDPLDVWKKLMSSVQNVIKTIGPTTVSVPASAYDSVCDLVSYTKKTEVVCSDTTTLVCVWIYMCHSRARKLEPGATNNQMSAIVKEVLPPTLYESLALHQLLMGVCAFVYTSPYKLAWYTDLNDNTIGYAHTPGLMEPTSEKVLQTSVARTKGDVAILWYSFYPATVSTEARNSMIPRLESILTHINQDNKILFYAQPLEKEENVRLFDAGVVFDFSTTDTFSLQPISETIVRAPTLILYVSETPPYFKQRNKYRIEENAEMYSHVETFVSIYDKGFEKTWANILSNKGIALPTLWVPEKCVIDVEYAKKGVWNEWNTTLFSLEYDMYVYILRHDSNESSTQLQSRIQAFIKSAGRGHYFLCVCTKVELPKVPPTNLLYTSVTVQTFVSESDGLYVTTLNKWVSNCIRGSRHT